MQIELIGCTSAGKSTLIKGVLQACDAQKNEIVLGDDFVLQQLRLQWFDNYLPRGLVINLVALVACLIAWPKNYPFYRFATRLLFQLPISRFDKLYMLRNVLKKTGVHELLRFFQTDQQVILVDEGVLQVAHNLFVHQSTQIDMDNLATFVRLTALPDVIVYLRQPESLLVDRTIRRGHPRIPDRSYENVAPFIRQAVMTFEHLVQEPAVARKLLVVEGGREVAIGANVQQTNRGPDALLGRALKILQNGIGMSMGEPLNYSMEQTR